MKLKYSIEISPIVALLLIVFAAFGCDAIWTRQRKQKRVTRQSASPFAQSSSRMPPAQATASKPPAPPTKGADVVVERDTPSALRRSSRLATPEELNARAGRIGLQAATEYYALRKGQVVDVQHQ